MKTPYIFAKRFVAGESYDVAEKKVRAINQKGNRVTLDLLGENIKDATTAAERNRRCLYRVAGTN
jgi:proline dehydrogenase